MVCLPPGPVFSTARRGSAHACQVALLLLLAALLLPVASTAQEVQKEVIAVLDLEFAGASAVEAAGITDRLREELLRTGRFTLADRSNIEAALKELALQQTGCTTQECALQVGRFLGVRKMVVGKVTRYQDKLWQLSGQLLDVETTQTVRVESVIHEGDLITLLRTGVTDLARKLAASPEQAATPGTARLTLELDPADVTVLLDNKAVQTERGRVTRTVEPGRHVVEVRDPSGKHVPQNRIVELGAGQDVVVTITLAPKVAGVGEPLPTTPEEIKKRCEQEAVFMLHPKHERFVSAVILSSSSHTYALTSFTTTLLYDRNQCEKKYNLKAGLWQQVLFVAEMHERLDAELAQGQGETVHGLAALMGCPALAPRVSQAGQRNLAHVLRRSDDDAVRYLLRLHGVLARDPALRAGCASLSPPA